MVYDSFANRGKKESMSDIKEIKPESGVTFGLIQINQEPKRFAINFGNSADNSKLVYVDLCTHFIMIEERFSYWLVWFSVAPTVKPEDFKKNPNAYKIMCHCFTGEKSEEDHDTEVLYNLFQDLHLKARFPGDRIHHLTSFEHEIEDCLQNKLKLSKESAQQVKAYLEKNKFA